MTTTNKKSNNLLEAIDQRCAALLESGDVIAYNALLEVRKLIIAEQERILQRLEMWEMGCSKRQNYNAAQAFKIAQDIVTGKEEKGDSK